MGLGLSLASAMECPLAPRAAAAGKGWDEMEPIEFFDRALVAALPGRTIEPAVVESDGTVRSGPLTLYCSSPFGRSTCVQPREDERAPFTVGIARCRAYPRKATLELCDRRSVPLIEVEAVVRDDRPDAVCDLGYGIAPRTAIDEGPVPGYCVLWPGKPTTNTVWTAVEGYTWFEAFSEEGYATGIACTPPHMGCAGLQRAEEGGR